MKLSCIVINSKEICNSIDHDYYTKTSILKKLPLKNAQLLNYWQFYLNFSNYFVYFPPFICVTVLSICYGLTCSESHPLFSEFHKGIDLVILVTNSVFTD